MTTFLVCLLLVGARYRNKLSLPPPPHEVLPLLAPPPPPSWDSGAFTAWSPLKAPAPLNEFEQEVCRTWSLNTSSWLLEQLLGTSWYFLTILNRFGKTKKFANMFTNFVTIWHVLSLLDDASSWAFLTVSQPLLDDFLMTFWWLKNSTKLSRKRQERFQKDVKNSKHNIICYVTNPPLCFYTRGQDR